MDRWIDSVFMQGMQRSEGRFSELISHLLTRQKQCTDK